VRLPRPSAGQGPVGVALTFPEITKVEELVAPLCKDAQRVLEEGHHDQEATDRGQVPGTSEHGVSACFEIPCLELGFENQARGSHRASTEPDLGTSGKRTASLGRLGCPTSPQSC
jgi:hypothetical protein